jgi:xylulokinase
VAAAALGSGAIEDGALHMCLGTSSWIGGFYAGRRLSARESYATITSSIDNRPLLIATQESAGACIDWFEGVSTPGNESPAHAEEVPPPLFLPWMAGERVPVDDNKLRGAFIGLTFRHARQSLANAVVEGIGLNTRWAYQSVARQRGTMRNQPMPLVGGAADNAELCQTLADCLNVDLIVGPAPRTAGMQGTGAIASAFLGWHGNAWAAACCLSRPAARVYTPDRERHRYFDQRFELFLKAFQQLKPWMREAHQGAAMP